MALFRRFFVGAGYSLLGASLHRVLLSGTGIVLARWLGVSEYGLYVNQVAAVNLLMMLGLFGMNTAFSTFIPGVAVVAREKAREVVVAGVIVVAALLALLVGAAWALATPAARLLYHSLLSGAELRLALPYAAALTVDTLLLAALFGYQEFRRYSLAMALLGVLVATGSVIGVWRGHLPGLLAGMAAAYALHAAYLWLVLRSLPGARVPLAWADVRARVRPLLAFAFPAFLAGLFNAPAYWLGNMLISRAVGPAASGHFGVASSLSQLVLFIPLTLAGPLVPMFSEIAAQGDRARFSTFVGRNTRMVWCLNLPVTVGLASVAPVIVRLLYGAAYAGASDAFAILACTNLLIAVQGVIAHVFIARRRMWEGFAVNAAWFAVVLALIGPLASRGQTGFALVLMAAYAASIPVLVAIVRRHVDGRALADRTGRLALLTLAGFGVAAWVARSGLPAAAILALGALAALATAGLEWRFALDAVDRTLVTGTLLKLAGRGSEPPAAADRA